MTSRSGTPGSRRSASGGTTTEDRRQSKDYPLGKRNGNRNPKVSPSAEGSPQPYSHAVAPPSSNPTTATAPSSGDTVQVMQQVLDQMERCFQTDHSARRDRILQLESRQKELEKMYVEAAEDTKQQHAAETAVIDEEVSKYSAMCDQSVNHLLEECRVQTEERKRFQELNEGLEIELRRLREVEAQNKLKIEQLAKNVVRALKERASMADELEDNKGKLESLQRTCFELREAASQRDDAITTLAEVRSENDANFKKSQLADQEVKRLSVMLERHVSEEQRYRRETAKNNEQLIGQVTAQLSEVSAEKDVAQTSMTELQLANQRLAEELREMIASRKQKDERLAQAERELVQERANRLSLEREMTSTSNRLQILEQIAGSRSVDTNARMSPASFADVEDGTASTTGTPTTVAPPPAGRNSQNNYETQKEVVRLQALLDRVQLEHSESLRHTEQRVLHANSLYEQANERCRGYEKALLELRQQAAQAAKEKTKAQMIVQALRQKLVGVQAEGATTSAAITTSKVDVEEAMANASTDLELRFSQQVHRDFASIAYFFNQLKAIDVDATVRIASHSIPGSHAMSSPATAAAPSQGTPALPPASSSGLLLPGPETGLLVAPYQLPALGGTEPSPAATDMGPTRGGSSTAGAAGLHGWGEQPLSSTSAAMSPPTPQSGPRRSPSAAQIPPPAPVMPKKKATTGSYTGSLVAPSLHGDSATGENRGSAAPSRGGSTVPSLVSPTS